MNNKSELDRFFRGILWLHCKNFISNKILYYHFIEINLSFCHVIFFKYWVISQFFKVEISIGQLGSISQCFKVEISLGQLGLIYVYKISPMIDFEFYQSFLHTLRANCMYITNYWYKYTQVVVSFVVRHRMYGHLSFPKSSSNLKTLQNLLLQWNY